jgi:hypothetical protein
MLALLNTFTQILTMILTFIIDENFGKVLGDYIGIAVEGLSGGGGADNNGLFFGNFIGTLLGSLSAVRRLKFLFITLLCIISFFTGPRRRRRPKA